MNKCPKILVVGSLVLDQIMSTKVFPRIGETVLGTAFRKAPGGKGANQAVQMARLGADVTLVGKIGNDSNGSDLVSACHEAGVDTSSVIISNCISSSCAVIILEKLPDGSTQNRIIVYPGANMDIHMEEIAFLKDCIAQYDIVVLQLEIPMEINIFIAKYAHTAGVPVMLNPAPYAPLPDELMQYVTYISPNETEAERLTGVSIPHSGCAVDYDAARHAAKTLQRRGVPNVLITLGSAGAVLYNDSGYFIAPCATEVVAVDPTAAGDSFVGAFCYAVCCGKPWRDSLIFANHTAALTVSAFGAIPSLPEIGVVNAFLNSRGFELFRGDNIC